MSVMNLDRVYFCCLYGNNEDEVIIRHLDRDYAYESELIALEDAFWNDHVQKNQPPDYAESNGNEDLSALRPRLYGYSAAEPVPAL